MKTVSGPNGIPLTASPVTKTCGTNLLRRISLTAAMPVASPGPTSTIIRSGRQWEAAAAALATFLSTAQTVWPRPSSVSASNAPIIASSSTTSVRSAFIEQPPHLRRPRSPRRRRCRATSIRPLQLPTPEQRYWSRAMLPLSSWNRRDCPARSLRSRPFLSYRRGMRFDEPQLMVDAARYLGEQIGCIRVADRRRLSDRFAGRLPERGKCRGDREQVLVFVGDPQGAPQARQVADRFHLLQNLRETIETQLSRADRSTGRALLPESKDEDVVTIAHGPGGRREVAEHRHLIKQAHRRSRQAVFDKVSMLRDLASATRTRCDRHY